MARGFEHHHQRLDAVALLGRPLARRARSRCELCEAAQVRLTPFEVAPLPEEPDPDRAAMLCDRCLAGAEGGRLDPHAWRCLETACWSEVPAVQVLAVRLAQRLGAQGSDWARDLCEALYLAPEVEAWLG